MTDDLTETKRVTATRVKIRVELEVERVFLELFSNSNCVRNRVLHELRDLELRSHHGTVAVTVVSDSAVTIVEVEEVDESDGFEHVYRPDDSRDTNV